MRTINFWIIGRGASRSDRTLETLVEGAIQYAKLAAELESPKKEDALKWGLDYLRKRKTNSCWHGLQDDLDEMAAKAALNFRRNGRMGRGIKRIYIVGSSKMKGGVKMNSSLPDR
ncbi:hypothetical protein DFS33DRAFT_1273648 [Desarmillaria ectypa]|nr:hypothetical protein DFS33DRAFT_1273648 [Desarmillaria ectypa]